MIAKNAPVSTALVAAIRYAWFPGSSSCAKGIANGVMIAIVPYEVPVAKETTAARTKINAGRINVGVLEESDVTRKFAVSKPVLLMHADKLHARIRMTNVKQSDFMPESQACDAWLAVNLPLATHIMKDATHAKSAARKRAIDASASTMHARNDSKLKSRAVAIFAESSPERIVERPER